MEPPTTDTTGMNPERVVFLRGISAGGNDLSITSYVTEERKPGPIRSGANATGLGQSVGGAEDSDEGLGPLATQMSTSSAGGSRKRSYGELEERLTEPSAGYDSRVQLQRPPLLCPVPRSNENTIYLVSLLRYRLLRLTLVPTANKKLFPAAGTHFFQITDAGLVMNETIRNQSSLPLLRLTPVTTAVDGALDRVARGALLEDVWSTLLPAAKYDMAHQLGKIVKLMRKTTRGALEMSDHQLGSVISGDYSLLLEKRQSRTYWAIRPRPTQAQFVAFLLAAMHPSVPRALVGRISNQFRETASVVLSHGELCPRNIIIDNTKIVAIVGWDCAGWYPEWWDYVKFFEPSTKAANADWYDYASEIFEREDLPELVAYRSIVRWAAPWPLP
ncbi:hypothetical protein DCS_05510 [Drechmeria coniospora]|uniref:Aminoglycoside phosphotransferase domain-containing protein n=1 Tax=Drechmeria coniospora TaxID=98403 RepID=A0A151GMZ6_DRECN|nr:hypothetical protein DCS_05510 [Drechmeria coniospora]KYK58494.1 hypothetical protein DCS_05510 [Drechmeria coniospora]